MPTVCPQARPTFSCRLLEASQIPSATLDAGSSLEPSRVSLESLALLWVPSKPQHGTRPEGGFPACLSSRDLGGVTAGLPCLGGTWGRAGLGQGTGGQASTGLAGQVAPQVDRAKSGSARGQTANVDPAQAAALCEGGAGPPEWRQGQPQPPQPQGARLWPDGKLSCPPTADPGSGMGEAGCRQLEASCAWAFLYPSHCPGLEGARETEAPSGHTIGSSRGPPQGLKLGVHHPVLASDHGHKVVLVPVLNGADGTQHHVRQGSVGLAQILPHFPVGGNPQGPWGLAGSPAGPATALSRAHPSCC